MAKKRKRKPDFGTHCRFCGVPNDNDHLDSCASTAPDWDHTCENCGETPIVPLTGLCGPCTFGKADTAGGNW